MIPRANITAWRNHAPWPSNAQVEQDLVLSRALVAMYERTVVAEQAAFRGGTALHKLCLDSAGRYSEDIDLVQRHAGPIGDLVNAIRDALDPWLGAPRWKQGRGRFTLVYRFETTFEPVVRMRLKVEINTREHFSVLGFTQRAFVVDNPWFSGGTMLSTYEPAELLGTKMRALYQRKKGRDLFDLWLALRMMDTDPRRIVECFRGYLDHEGVKVSRAVFEANLAAKLEDESFSGTCRSCSRRGQSTNRAWQRCGYTTNWWRGSPAHRGGVRRFGRGSTDRLDPDLAGTLRTPPDAPRCAIMPRHASSPSPKTQRFQGNPRLRSIPAPVVPTPGRLTIPFSIQHPVFAVAGPVVPVGLPARARVHALHVLGDRDLAAGHLERLDGHLVHRLLGLVTILRTHPEGATGDGNPGRPGRGGRLDGGGGHGFDRWS